MADRHFKAKALRNDPVQRRKIVSLYVGAYLSARAIGERFGVAPDTIKDILVQEGITLVRGRKF